jgi:hypothetical protein
MTQHTSVPMPRCGRMLRASSLRKHTWVQLVAWCSALLLAMVPEAAAQGRGYNPPSSPPRQQPYTPPPSRPYGGSQQSGSRSSSPSSGGVQMKPRAPMYPGSTQGQRPASPAPAARSLPPTIKQNSPVATMKGYTGQVTVTGKPLVMHHGKTYQIPQRGISSSLRSGTSHAAVNSRWTPEGRAKAAKAIGLLAKGAVVTASVGAAVNPDGPSAQTQGLSREERRTEAALERREQDRRLAKFKADKAAEETHAESKTRDLKVKQEDERQRVTKEQEDKKKKDEARKEEQRRRLAARARGEYASGMSGTAANMPHDFKRHAGKTPPDHPDAHRLPYDRGRRAREIVVEKETVFVRVHGTDNQGSSWLMRREDLYDSNGKQLTAQQLKDKFALKELPTHVSDVHVPANTRLRVGTVAPQEGWGEGGAIQYELKGKDRLPESAFRDKRKLE